MVAISLFSIADYEAFLAGISSITGQLTYDRSVLDKTTFLARYGHLRPGPITLNLLGMTNRQRDILIGRISLQNRNNENLFSPTSTQLSEISSLLKAHELKPNASELLDFMKAAIELREMAKFYFTHNLSDALSLIIKVGEKYKISREDLAYCDISVFRELHMAAANTRNFAL